MSYARQPGARVRAIAVTLVLTAAVGSATASAATKTKPVTARSSLSLLVRQTNALPTSALPRGAKATLLRLAGDARRAAVGSPCRSIGDLNRFRTTLKRIKLRGKLQRSRRTSIQRQLAQLGASSLTA